MYQDQYPVYQDYTYLAYVTNDTVVDSLGVLLVMVCVLWIFYYIVLLVVG